MEKFVNNLFEIFFYYTFFFQTKKNQMFLEVEKARLLRLEVQLLEEEGNYEKAAELIQDVQVKYS
jgi:hypothetical protein